MRIAAFQFDVRRGEVQTNLAAVLGGLREAADLGVELLLLPEMWPTSFMTAEDMQPWLLASEDAVGKLREASRELGLAVAGSSFGPNEAGRPFNTMQLFDAGEQVLTYHKVHLFSPTAEDQAFTAGERAPGCIEWRGWKLAAGICYDLRFPGIWKQAFREQAELVLVSAQWPVVRSRHWELLLQGRAVEHQAFFLGANRTGMDLLGRRQKQLEFPGKSMLVSPHGEVLARGDAQTGLVVGEIQRDEMRELRRTLPVRRDERLA